MEQNLNWFWLIFLLFALVFCFFCSLAFLTTREIYLFNKTVGKLTLTQKSLFGTIAIAQHSLQEISDIQLSEKPIGRVREGVSDRQDNYYLVSLSLEARDNKYILGEFSQKQNAEAAITQMREFLT